MNLFKYSSGTNINFANDKGINPGANKWLNYSLAGLAFVIPLSRSGISILVAVIILLWVMEGGWQFKWQKLRSDRLILVIAAYLGFICLSLLWTDNYTKAFLNVRNYGHLILIPVMLTSLNRNFRLKVINSYALGVLLLAILSILNFTYVITISRYYSHGDYKNSAHVLMHHLDYSMILAWTSILGLYFVYFFLFNKDDKKNTLLTSKIQLYLWIPLTLICFFWIFVQTGRTGQLSLAVTLPFLVFLILKERSKILSFVIIGSFIMILISQYQWNSKFKSRIDEAKSDISAFINQKEYSTSLGNRLLAHNIAWDMIKKSWLVGYGIGDNMDIFAQHVEILEKEMIQKKMPRLKTIYEVTTSHMHSQYLQVLTETGLIGFALFTGMFVFFVMGSNYRQLSFLLVVLFFTGFIGEPFMRNQFSSVLLCFFMGILYKSGLLDSGYVLKKIS